MAPREHDTHVSNCNLITCLLYKHTRTVTEWDVFIETQCICLFQHFNGYYGLNKIQLAFGVQYEIVILIYLLT